ncbi:MAG: hypothetical protein ABR512_11360 [Desulfopila sp.]
MSTPSSQNTVTDAHTLNEFMSSLHRLFKIGIYYPSGHATLDRATDRFMSQLEQLAGDKKEVAIQAIHNTIILEEIELDSQQPAIKEFNILLSTLGISTLYINRLISMAELHDFVRKMLAYKAKVLNAKQFIQVEVTDLPHSITIEQHEFLARNDRFRHDDSNIDNLDTFVASLTGFGLNEGEIQQCRELLDSLPEQLTQSKIDIGDLPLASWDDVAGLLAKAVKGGRDGGQSAASGITHQRSINDLSSILKKLEKETHDTKSREALNLLVSIIRKPTMSKEQKPEEEELSRGTFPEKPDISIERISEFVANQKLSPQVCQKIPNSSSRNETLSILMQLAGSELPLPSQIHMQQLCREALSTTLTEKTLNILSGGMVHLAQQGKTTRLAATIRLMLDPLRRSAGAGSLVLFQSTIKQCGAKEKLPFWPHVVNEMLVQGSQKDTIAYQQLCQYAARLSHEQMSAALPVLRNLEAFQETKIASDIFHGIHPAGYPLFAFLLTTDIECYIGERVIGGLRRRPRDWLIKAVVPLLDINEQEHKLFLYSYLRQASQNKLSSSLLNIATKILTTALPSLPQERRSEQWLANSITAMGQLPGTSTAEVLKQIAGAKKMLFIPQWPAPCRTAAHKALAEIKGNY